MKQFIRVAGSAVFMFLAMSTVAFAQEEAAAKTAAALINLTAPFGGCGISGIGREGGDYALDFYSDLKMFQVLDGTTS